MFDSFRQSLEDLMNRATPPEERREITARMRTTLAEAKAGVAGLRDALDKSQNQLSLEERELTTIRRRKQLAEGIGDRETVDIAIRFEQMHAERAAILRRKISAEEAEVTLAEREVDSMSAELKAALAGVPPAASGSIDPAAGSDPEAGHDHGALRDEFDAMRRTHERSRREADADRRLDELKRRMGGSATRPAKDGEGGGGGGGGAGGS